MFNKVLTYLLTYLLIFSDSLFYSVPVYLFAEKN